MMDAEKHDRGMVRVDVDECKGCGLCVEACPPRVLALSERLNHSGYRTAMYAGAGCTGCGICFMACPEPGAITVLRAMRHAENPGLGMKTAMNGEMPCVSN
ncbi:MAG: 4Fe-4S dicluster domain-containing protein [Terracidiphilus sp.]